MADSGEPSSAPKAIASLAKKPSDVTRQGTQKLKFVPTLPARRRKEEVTQEVTPASAQPSDKGDGKGRGRGRGTAPRPPQAEMTASGPFAMGPALAGTSARRSIPRSNPAPAVSQGSAKEWAANLSRLAAPTLRKDKPYENPLVDPTQLPTDESDDEVYSEPDEGVEIIDMANVWQLDWMAPETLQRDRRTRKAEAEERPSTKDKDSSDMLNLSGSEEEVEDLREEFTMQANMAEEGIRQERLYFFQFPEPFPTFASTPEPPAMDVDTPVSGPSKLKRKVSFATDAVPPGSTPAATPEAPKIDGVIGHVEVYRSGAVRMHLGNGIILNVSEATQPSFLQQAVHLDTENKRLHVLGEIDKRFVVSPNLDALLASLELADASATTLDSADLIKMDAI